MAIKTLRGGLANDAERLARAISSGAMDDGSTAGAEMKIVLNWFEELKRLVPTQ